MIRLRCIIAARNEMAGQKALSHFVTMPAHAASPPHSDVATCSWGSNATSWGMRRYMDGHPEVFNITVFELGNEQVRDAVRSSWV